MSPARPVTGNAGVEEQVKAAAETERVQTNRDEDDLFTVCSTAQGRRFMLRLLKASGLFSDVFVQSSAIYANAARHDFGLEIKGWLDAMDPNVFMTMLKEQKEDDDAR